MVEIIVLILMVVTLLWAAFGPIGLATKRVNGKTRKLEPHEFDWGDGKDLSYYLQFKPVDKLTEIEQWYLKEKSKDGRIQQLEALVSAKSTQIMALADELQTVKKEKEWHENYSKKPSMILDKPKPRKNPYDPYSEKQWYPNRRMTGIPVSDDIWYDRRGDVLQFDRDVTEIEMREIRKRYMKELSDKKHAMEYEQLFTMDGAKRTLYDRLHEDDEWDF